VKGANEGPGKENTTMSREKQRENRRAKSGQLNEKPWLNREGYRDPTAYEALRRIERKSKTPSKTTI
jgi:hypothetical protein